MNTNYKAHVGHRLSYDEPVTQTWEIEWVDGAPKRTKVTDETVQDTGESLYCNDCDLFLTDYEDNSSAM